MLAVRHGRIALLAVLVVAAAGLIMPGQALVPASAAPGPRVPAARSAAGLVTVMVTPWFRRRGWLKPGFAGLSIAADEVNSGNFSDTGELPALLRDLGPGVLRFGGNAVDRASYRGISATAAKGLASLLASTGWRVLYSVNLGTFSAAGVRADASRVRAALGRHLLAIACGNEPELYAGGYRPSNYDEAAYLATDVPRCLKAVKSGAPRTGFAGPDTFRVHGGPGHWVVPWIGEYAKAARSGEIPGLSLLAVHFYALNHCSKHGSPGGTPALLSAASEDKERGALAAFRSAARTAGVRYLITESNSANCTGITGTSDTYASALWAADWLMLAAERSAAGIDFNGGISSRCAPYTPLCGTGDGRYAVRPIYYGMLFTLLLGTGVTFFTPLRISGAAPGAHVVTHAVQSSSGILRVEVENLSGQPFTVLLKDGRVSGRAKTWYLTGPSLSATSGVRIQGAAVRSNGTFRPGAPGSITCRAGQCKLVLPAYSAVIVRLPR